VKCVGLNIVIDKMWTVNKNTGFLVNKDTG
jgi:hypothetical protein